MPMKKIELTNHVLTVYDEGVKHFELNNLRLVFSFLPGKFSYYVIGSSQQINSLNIDFLDDEKSASFQMEMGLIEASDVGLDSYKFYLGNYTGQTALLSIKELKANRISLIPLLFHYKNERITKRNEWVKTYPQLSLKGSMGSSMILTVDGLRIKKKFLEWDKVAKYEIQKNNFGLSHFLIIPKGIDARFFSFTKYKYCLSNIPTKKYPLYMAECEFWRYLKDHEGSNDLINQLKKLQELKDSGILTNERFEEAKQKLLTSL
jgi:hypothetical protein